MFEDIEWAHHLFRIIKFEIAKYLLTVNRHLSTILKIAVMVQILGEEEFQKVVPLLHECLKILNGLITYFESSNLK